MNRLKLAIIAGGALYAAPVLADDQAEPAAGGTTEAAPDPNAAGGGAGAGMSTTADTGGAGSLTWSRSAIDRPYVVNKGKIGAELDYSILKFSFVNPLDPTMSATITGDGLGISAGYGITEKITAGLSYGFTPGLIGDADSEIKGNLGLYGMYQIMHDAKLDVTATAGVGFGLANDPVTKGLAAGLGARYTLAPKMAVYTGGPYGPGLVGNHLQISLDSDGPITFGLPLGFMYQATPELNVHLDTQLATIAISNAGDSAFFGADYIPLGLGGLFSVTPNIDVQASFTLPDVKEVGFDLYVFSLGARYYN